MSMADDGDREKWQAATGTNNSISPKAFSNIFLETLEDTLTQVLGQTAASAILVHLEKNMGVGREEFPQNIQAFCSCMASLLGPGAPALEDLMLKRLFFRLQIQHDGSKDTFEGHIQRLWKMFEAEEV